ncbi:MAG: hypothetical protein V4850_08530 [Myxococcota bacterium]
MPQVSVAAPWFELEALNAAYHALLGTRTTVLRCVEGDVNTRESAFRVYALEMHDEAWEARPPWRWVERAELDAVVLVAPEQRAWIARGFDDPAQPRLDSAGVSALWPPWAWPGWFARAESFVAAELARCGLAATAPIIQVRAWQRSCVLRADTASGGAFFKASPRMFPHEAAVAGLLAARYPDFFPEVLAIDRTEGWMVMRALEGHTLSEIPDLGRWEEAARCLARFQFDCAAHVAELARCGCPRWPLDRIADRLGPLLADTDAMLIGTPEGLTEEEARELRARLPALRNACAQLAGVPVPESFEHGDLRGAHIIANGGGYRMFDLSDGAIAHPFYSAVSLLDYDRIPAAGGSHEAARIRLRDAYLSVWAPLAPMERLVSAFEQARVVAILYAALLRYDVILPAIQPRENWSFMIPYWLRKLLVALRERPDTVGSPWP